MAEHIILKLDKTELEYDILHVTLTTAIIKVEDAIQVKFPLGFDEQKGLIINGRGPIWLYLILYRRIKNEQSVAWLAQFDPQVNGAVKIDSDDSDHIIDISEFSKYISRPQKSLIIAFIGPPHSGKSVFLYSLFKSLLDKNPEYVNKNIFIIKGCPDGEGLWSSTISQELVKELRYKNQFSDAYVLDVISNIEKAARSKKIIFVDCGGKIADDTKQILSKCTHAILVSADKQKAEVWEQAYPDIKYLAIIDSFQNDPTKYSHILSENAGTFNIEMIDLDRENKNVSIPEEFLEFFLKQ